MPSEIEEKYAVSKQEKLELRASCALLDPHANALKFEKLPDGVF